MVSHGNKSKKCRVNFYWDGDTGEVWVDDVNVQPQ